MAIGKHSIINRMHLLHVYYYSLLYADNSEIARLQVICSKPIVITVDKCISCTDVAVARQKLNNHTWYLLSAKTSSFKMYSLAWQPIFRESLLK
jgi:hypothetical protein